MPTKRSKPYLLAEYWVSHMPCTNRPLPKTCQMRSTFFHTTKPVVSTGGSIFTRYTDRTVFTLLALRVFVVAVLCFRFVRIGPLIALQLAGVPVGGRWSGACAPMRGLLLKDLRHGVYYKLGFLG